MTFVFKFNYVLMIFLQCAFFSRNKSKSRHHHSYLGNRQDVVVSLGRQSPRQPRPEAKLLLRISSDFNDVCSRPRRAPRLVLVPLHAKRRRERPFRHRVNRRQDGHRRGHEQRQHSSGQHCRRVDVRPGSWSIMGSCRTS